MAPRIGMLSTSGKELIAVPNMHVIHLFAVADHHADPTGSDIGIVQELSWDPVRLLVQWMGGDRVWEQPSTLRAVQWPSSAIPAVSYGFSGQQSRQPKPQAKIDVEWLDGGVSIGRTIGAYSHTFGFTVEQAEQIWVRLSAMLSNVEDNGLASQLLEWKHRAVLAEQQLKPTHNALSRIGQLIEDWFPDERGPEDGVVDVVARLLQILRLQREGVENTPAEQDEQNAYDLGAALAEVDRRMVRFATSFMAGLKSEPSVQADTPERVADVNGVTLHLGDIVALASTLNKQHPHTGLVSSIYTEGGRQRVAVTWPGGGLLVHDPEHLARP